MKRFAGRMKIPQNLAAFWAALMVLLQVASAAAAPETNPWPELHRQTRPWAYWWWMASAVDQTNLARELQRYHDAGLGGVHIIPIYGAKGYESRFIDYLSPNWMEMLHYTVTEADRLGLGVDMSTGSGWCFGGPHVTDQEANALAVAKSFELRPGEKLAEKLKPGALQALMAFSPEGKFIDLEDKLSGTGTLDWSPAQGAWQVYAISQRPSGQKVKRAAPGGQGHMLNLIYPEAMRHYLQWFDAAFTTQPGPMPRAMYHDSYEYRSDWAPDFFAAFEKRRGYRLQTELPALFGRRSPTSSSAAAAPDDDHVARVKSDYRETISDVMVEDSLPLWTAWSRRHGFLTRNEAHGSPGNWLDLYALADIPETEMFHTDRNKLISKFASSAAHVTGRQLVAAETGTWLAEHFTETLAEMKYLVDDLFLSGVNHVFYHGTCYSPDDAPWPGWLFYASYEMNPRNSIWRDVPTLNAYVARCQSVLQSGHPDNDLLLYWPIFDLWHNPAGLVRPLTVHARDWFEQQPIGNTAARLWNRGYAFDYISDRQLTSARQQNGRLTAPGGSYRAILVPPTRHMPAKTLRTLLALAESGATIVFEERLPEDVPGWSQLAYRRRQFRSLIERLNLTAVPGSDLRTARIGHGQILVGNLEQALATAGIPREKVFDQPGLTCIRRGFEGGHYYFIANRSEQRAVNDWITLARPAKSITLMDPLTGRFGTGTLRQTTAGPEVFLFLQPGESLILRCLDAGQPAMPRWTNWQALTPPTDLDGPWDGEFLHGGPEIPKPFHLDHLASWITLADTNAQRFAGTAVYRLTFDAPPEPQRDSHASDGGQHWWIDLGKVCQSARVRLNGRDLGTLLTPPFRVVSGALKPKGNRLEIEVTNVSANRIRDLDRRHVNWKNFYDINFVDLSYKPFDASNWPLTDSGLLGPVTLTPIAPIATP